MELHQLRYFLAVAQTRNFSRAAERCHVAQPSLSQQIMKLEDELGEKLLERTRRHVALTAAGELFIGHATRVLAEIEEARERVRDVRGLIRGRVVLGALPTVAPYVLPAWLRGLERRHGAVEVTVHEDTTANLVRLVREREVDLAVVSLPVAARDIESTSLFEENLLVVLPQDHALTRRRVLKLGDLKDEAFILMQEGHCLAGQSLQFCQARGLAPQIKFRSAQMETVQAFVAGGFGVSLVPAMVRAAGDFPGVVYRPLVAPAPRRSLGLIALRGRRATHAMSALSAYLVETVGAK